MIYATLHAVLEYLDADEQNTRDDARLTRFLVAASKYIDQNHRRCDIRLETRRFDYPLRDRGGLGLFGTFSVQEWVAQANASGDVARGLLRVDDDLLEATAITNGDGVAVAADEFIYEPANEYPRFGVRLLPSSGKRWVAASNGNDRQCLPLTGWWGYHDDYLNAFLDSLDSVQNGSGLTAQATSITVTDPAGIAADLISPRFQAGQLLRIGTELMTLLAVNTTTKVLTVRRGVNGTTAAAHAQGAPIDIFKPMATVEQAVIRLTVWRYRQKDANVFDKTTILATGEQITPSSIPPDVIDLLPPKRVTL